MSTSRALVVHGHARSDPPLTHFPTRSLCMHTRRDLHGVAMNYLIAAEIVDCVCQVLWDGKKHKSKLLSSSPLSRTWESFDAASTGSCRRLPPAGCGTGTPTRACTVLACFCSKLLHTPRCNGSSFIVFTKLLSSSSICSPHTACTGRAVSPCSPGEPGQRASNISD